MSAFRFILILALASAAPGVKAVSPDAEKTRRLVAVVRSAAPVEQRARALQQLALVGSKDAVPALVGLLEDEHLGQYARDALEQMPDPAAGEALRSALDRLRGHALIGVVNSLGARRDGQAVPALEQLAGAPGTVASGPALLALGRIGTPEAASFLVDALARDPQKLREAAAEACLIVASRQRQEGQNDAARIVFEAVRSAAGLPIPVRITAARGVMRCGGPHGMVLLVEELHSSDPARRAVALGSTRDVPGPEVAAALVAELDRLDPAVAARVLSLAVDRGGPDLLGPVEARAKEGSGPVRRAAIRALGRVGQASSVPILLAAIDPELPDGLSDAALESLAQISAAETDGAILAALPEVKPAARSRLIGVLGERRATEATPELLRLAKDPDPQIVRAALGALGLTARLDDLPALIDLARSAPDDSTRTLADSAVALTAMKEPEPGRRSEAALLAFRQAANPTAKAALLPLLSAVVQLTGGSHRVFFAVRNALRDPDPAVRRAALQCLADWPDATPATTLLAVAERTDGPAEEHEIAWSGAVRQMSKIAGGHEKSPLNLAAALAQAKRAARTDAEQGTIAEALGGLKRPAAATVTLNATATATPAPHSGAAPLFDGRDLAGWVGDPAVWRVEQGLIVGGSMEGNPRNEFLATLRSYKNFILRAEYKLVGTQGTVNSGIQFRSIHLSDPPNEMYGYQADIGNGHTGGLYDESRRKVFLAAADSAQIKRLEKPGDWNQYEVRCEGPRIEIWLNGERTVAYTEADPAIPLDGLIGLQIHAHGKAEVSFRNLMIEELP